MLYIIRHGQTDWNVSRKLQGQTDIPLNDTGREMAKKAAKECADIHFDVCFCSPLCRAKETADILFGARDIPIVYDERLKEMGFGRFEGHENSYDDPNCPASMLFKHPEQYDGSLTGGETMQELFDRTGEFLREEVEPRLKQGLDVVIVGHGAMNSCIVCQIKGRDRKDFWTEGIENCKLYKLL